MELWVESLGFIGLRAQGVGFRGLGQYFHSCISGGSKWRIHVSLMPEDGSEARVGLAVAICCSCLMKSLFPQTSIKFRVYGLGKVEVSLGRKPVWKESGGCCRIGLKNPTQHPYSTLLKVCSTPNTTVGGLLIRIGFALLYTKYHFNKEPCKDQYNIGNSL